MKKTVLSSLLLFSLTFSQVRAEEELSPEEMKAGSILLGVGIGAAVGIPMALYLTFWPPEVLYNVPINFIERKNRPIFIATALGLAYLYSRKMFSELVLARGAYRYRDPSAHPDSFLHKFTTWEKEVGVDYSLDELREIRNRVRNGYKVPSELAKLVNIYGEEKFLSVLREEIEVVEYLIMHKKDTTIWRKLLPFFGFFSRRIQAYIANALKSGEAFKRLDEYHAYLCCMEEIFLIR